MKILTNEARDRLLQEYAANLAANWDHEERCDIALHGFSGIHTYSDSDLIEVNQDILKKYEEAPPPSTIPNDNEICTIELDAMEPFDPELLAELDSSHCYIVQFNYPTDLTLKGPYSELLKILENHWFSGMDKPEIEEMKKDITPCQNQEK